MAKLPVCPHCDKLLIQSVGQDVKFDGKDKVTQIPVTMWQCPETLESQDPVWYQVASVIPVAFPKK